MKEIESLVRVKDTKQRALKILSKFKSYGAKQITDVYFYPLAGQNLIRPGENLTRWFRLRKNGDESAVAYKIDKFDNKGKWIYSEEYETGVSDFYAMNKIIRNLGFKELIRLENKKYVFLTEKYEIVLEDVKNLGLFLEVEQLKVKKGETPIKYKREIQTFIDNLGIIVSEELNCGKPELMLAKKKKDKLNK